MNEIRFTVLGDPVAQARPRATRMGNGIRLYDPAKVRDYKGYFKFCAAQHAPSTLIDAPLSVSLAVYVQKPKSWAKGRTQAACKPDLDNFCKAALDSMEGVLYTNDSRIVELRLSKHLSDTPRVEVSVREIG